MTKNKTLLLLLATAFILASCISESILPDIVSEGYYGEERTVSIRLTQGASTRGVSRPICDGEPVHFNHGMFYLTTEAGIIVRHFEITPYNGAVTNLTNGIINIECLEEGIDIGLVPGNVRRVVIIGNSQMPLPTTGNVNTISAGLVSGNVGGVIHNTIASQHNPLAPVGVNMFADANLEYISTLPNYTRRYGAEMTLTPLVARFELAQITGSGQIRSFSVAGIYIDRYYRQARRSGAFPTEAAPVSYGTNSADFAPGVNNFITADTYNYGARTRTSGALFTAYSPAQPAAARVPAGVIARPASVSSWECLVTDGMQHTDESNTWAFQVFTRYARGATPAPNSPNTTPPAIIVRLNDVVVYTDTIGGSGTQNIGTWYLTVGGFRIAPQHAGAGTPLTDIRASNVYRIANLPFNESNLTERPNERPITAEVTIELAEWNGRPIAPAGLRQPNPQDAVVGCVPVGHTFVLGAAIGSCLMGTITYRWEERVMVNGNTTWSVVRAASTDPNFTTPVPNFTTPVTPIYTRYFRRVAICGCGTDEIASSVARVMYRCCIPIGSGAQFACWAPYNLYRYGVFVDAPGAPGAHHRGSLFQWGSRVAWTAPQFPATTAVIQRWNVGATAWTTGTTDYENVSLGGHPPSSAWDWAIHDPCPAGWQLPTQQQLTGLGTGVWHSNWNGFGPGRVFGPSGGAVGIDQIFLPAAARRNNAGALTFVGTSGFIWSSAPSGSYATMLQFSSGSPLVHAAYRANSLSVRCVAEE